MFVCLGLSLGGSEHDFGNLLGTLAGSLGTSRAHWGCPWGPLVYIIDGWTMIASCAYRSAHAIRIIIFGIVLCWHPADSGSSNDYQFVASGRHFVGSCVTMCMHVVGCHFGVSLGSHLGLSWHLTPFWVFPGALWVPPRCIFGSLYVGHVSVLFGARRDVRSVHAGACFARVRHIRKY